MKNITILTEPISWKTNLKRVLRKVLKNKIYGGHVAVTHSLIEGLNKTGYQNYNYQPFKESDLAEHVHVLAGVDTLRYAIKLKRQGKIKRLTAGPNVVVFSDDFDSLIASGEIDLYLQPSQWAADFHIQLEPTLSGRCIAWPIGVDIEKFNSAKYKKNSKRVLIYHKEESKQFMYRVDYLVRKYGYETTVITYGEYKLEDYIKKLGESLFAVVISRQESQGVFLAEAWAMNVPTLCFDPHYYKWEYSDKPYELAGNISTCPYLTEYTGARWGELSQLANLLDDIDMILNKATPRKWVEENMTDEVCARDFLSIVGADS